MLKEEGMSRLSEYGIADSIPQILEAGLVDFCPQLVGEREENGIEG